MKKYHPPPPPEMHLLPQSNHYINNNSHGTNSVHGVLKKPPTYQDDYGDIREEEEDFSSQSSYGSHKNRDFRSGSHGGSQDDEVFPEIYTREPRFANIIDQIEYGRNLKNCDVSIYRIRKNKRVGKGLENDCNVWKFRSGLYIFVMFLGVLA